MTRTKIQALGRRVEPAVYAALRIVAGAMFAVHGVQKLFGWHSQHVPPVGTQLWFGGLIELLGGLFIALGLFLVVGLLFGLYPELDIKLSAAFYDATHRTFPLKLNGAAAFARDAAMWIAWAFVLPSFAALIWKAIRPDRPLLVKGRTILFLVVTLALSAGVLTNLTFKTYWGRPRPVVVTEFNGPEKFVPWWDPRGTCGRNC